MPPRRKPLLDLESELQGDHEDTSARPKLRRARNDDSPQETRGDDSPKQSKPASTKKKEFAWMDSDAEDSDNDDAKTASSVKGGKTGDDPGGLFDGDGDGRSGSRKRRRKDGSRSPSAHSRSSSEGPPLPASVAEVMTFSQMVRMADGLKKRVRSMETTELVQCVAAAARVKFYDGSFLQDMVIPEIRRHLNPRRRAPYTTPELVSILCALADLNCFDKEVFNGSVKELADRRYMELKSEDRIALLMAFKAVKYDCNGDRQFYDWLSTSVKAERYEVMSAEQRMIVGNSKNGMHAPADYLRSFMIGTSSGSQVTRPHGLSS